MKAQTPESELFRESFNASPIGIAVETLEGQPLFVNPALCTMLGFTEGELRSKHCQDFSPPEDAQKDWALFQQLRAGSIDHYQLEKRYFRGNGSLMWGRLNLSLLNGRASPLVLAMVEDITEQKKAQDALTEQTALLQSREELLGVFVKNVPAAVAMLDRDMRYLQVSDRWCTDYLSGRAQVLGRSHYEIFPDMPDRWKEIHRRALQGETLRADEDRWDGQDGAHWARWEVRPWNTADGAVGGILILTEDITVRKQMEEALTDLSRKLMQSQEQERARIGRELHDDINQRIAVVVCELHEMGRRPSGEERRSRKSIESVTEQLTRIASDIQAISHRLHSSHLEYIGLAAAAEVLCRELRTKHQVEIEFRRVGIPRSLPKDISLCLYRVLQEGLQNAIKHSGVRQFKVELIGNSSVVQLTIRDNGVGFDPTRTDNREGLGLISMRERIRLVHGDFALESEPGRGTAITCKVTIGNQASQWLISPDVLGEVQ